MSYFSLDPFESDENHEGDIDTITLIREQMLTDIERIQAILFDDTYVVDQDYENLSDEEKKICDNFLNFYSICPICKGENHKDDLMRFYFEETEFAKKLRNNLLKLMDNSKNYKDKIVIGIPCCQCFKKIFGNTKNI